jgi:hypothetical protein
MRGDRQSSDWRLTKATNYAFGVREVASGSSDKKSVTCGAEEILNWDYGL